MNQDQAREIFTALALSSTRAARSAFSLQLPYLNPRTGSPVCVEISRHDAEKLVVSHASHKLLEAEADYFVVTPLVPASVGVEFQIGEPRL